MGREIGMTYDDVVDHIRRSFPELLITDPDLQPVVLGALGVLLGDSLGSGAPRPELTTRIVEFIERAARSGDARLLDQLQVSFLENLGDLGPNCPVIVDRLGPQTLRLLRGYERRWGAVCPQR